MPSELQPPPRTTWTGLVAAALREDIGPGDATSLAVIPAAVEGRATLVARQALVVCGLEVAGEVFARCGARLDACCADGDTAGAGQALATVAGSARALLAAERTALNFLQRLCGVASHVQRFCQAVEGTRAAIVDTRKTTPGWRALEKYAVRCGGGRNHRSGLFDGILIKDNHIAALGSLADAIKRARSHGAFGLRVQVEVESLAQAEEALQAGADALLVDNQPLETLRAVVQRVAGALEVEASGGITLENVAAVAATGVDRISVGALTHSAPAADLALEWTAP